MLHVAAITTGPAWQARELMLAEADAAVTAAVRAGAQLIVLPELFALPYVASEEPARWRHLAERRDGVTCRWASAVARRLGLHLLFGMALDDGGRLPVNAAMLATPDGEVVAFAEKINLPPKSNASFGESDHFRPGRWRAATLSFGSARIAAIICFDRRFPECWRGAMEAGADLVAVLVAGPAPHDPLGIYEAELRTHARANAVFVAAAARCGTEAILGRPVAHEGATLVVDCDGAVVAEAPPQVGGSAHVTLTAAMLAHAQAARASRIAGRHAYANILGRETQ